MLTSCFLSGVKIDYNFLKFSKECSVFKKKDFSHLTFNNNEKNFQDPLKSCYIYTIGNSAFPILYRNNNRILVGLAPDW